MSEPSDLKLASLLASFCGGDNPLKISEDSELYILGKTAKQISAFAGFVDLLSGISANQTTKNGIELAAKAYLLAGAPAEAIEAWKNNNEELLKAWTLSQSSKTRLQFLRYEVFMNIQDIYQKLQKLPNYPIPADQPELKSKTDA